MDNIVVTQDLDFHNKRKMRFLAHLLIFSFAINIFLCSAFVYLSFKERQFMSLLDGAYLEAEQAKLKTAPLNNIQLLQLYSTAAFPELLTLLRDKELVEQGYRKRDLSLACLVAFHHFDMERALGGIWGQRRKASFPGIGSQESVSVVLFSGLEDDQYKAIIEYATTEKWPFDAEGLFLHLKNTPIPKDQALLQSFYLTTQFHEIYNLFDRSSFILEKEILVNMLLEGSWDTVSKFVVEQQKNKDISDERRRELLVLYTENGSKIAARILIETDSNFASSRLSDVQVLQILSLLSKKTKEFETFTKNVFAGGRSDPVLKAAARKLYEFAEEPFPEEFDYAAIAKKFVPQTFIYQMETVIPKSLSAPAEEPQVKQEEEKIVKHTVRQGDNLWKIAKHYKVSIEQIRSLNGAKSSLLRIGDSLVIKRGKEVVTTVVAPKMVNVPKPIRVEKTTTDDYYRPPHRTVNYKPAEKMPKISKRKTHAVRPGENLWTISKKYGVKISDLRRLNSLSSDSLKPGQKVVIP